MATIPPITPDVVNKAVSTGIGRLFTPLPSSAPVPIAAPMQSIAPTLPVLQSKVPANNYITPAAPVAGPNVNAYAGDPIPLAPNPDAINANVSPSGNAADIGKNKNVLQTPPIPKSGSAAAALGVKSDVVGTAPVAPIAPAPTADTIADDNVDISNPNPGATDSASIKQWILKLLGAQSTEGAVTQNLNDENGVDTKTQTLNDLTNRYTTTQKSYTDKIAALQKNPEGKFGGAVESDVANMTRLMNSDLANIAIQKSVAQGDLTTANDLVEAKVKAEFEPISDIISGLQTYYNLNQNDLSDSDKLNLQADIAAKQSDLDYAHSKALQDDKIAAGLISPDAASTTHIVTAGEASGGLYQIAQNLGVDFDALKAANSNLDDGSGDADTNYAISAGQTINLPAGSAPIPTALQPYLNTAYDGTKYADLSSLTPTDKVAYGQAAQASGVKPIFDSATAGKIDAISVAKENLTKINDSITGLLGAAGGGNITKGVGNSLKSALGTQGIKDYNAWRTAIINNVQALAGGQGSGLRINQAEIDAAMNNDLPVITGFGADSIGSAQGKLTKLNSQLNTWNTQLLGGGNQAAKSSVADASGSSLYSSMFPTTGGGPIDAINSFVLSK